MSIGINMATFFALACRRCCCPARQTGNGLPHERPAIEGNDNLPMFNSEPAFLVVNPGEILSLSRVTMHSRMSLGITGFSTLLFCLVMHKHVWPAAKLLNCAGGLHNIAFQANESFFIADLELDGKHSTASNDIPAAISSKSGHKSDRQESSLIKAVHATGQEDATGEAHGSQTDIELAQLRLPDHWGAGNLPGSKRNSSS